MLAEIPEIAQVPFDPVVLDILTNFEEEYLKYKKKAFDSKIAYYLNSKNVTNHGVWKMKNKDIVIASKNGNQSNINSVSVVFFNDKTLYIGSLVNSQRSGIGYRTYKGSNLIYCGEYAHDVKFGKGKLYNLEEKKWVFE